MVGRFRADGKEGVMTEPKIAAFGKLQQDLGLLDAVGIGLGAVIGAGIFVVTGVAAVFPQSTGT